MYIYVNTCGKIQLNLIISHIRQFDEYETVAWILIMETNDFKQKSFL